MRTQTPPWKLPQSAAARRHAAWAGSTLVVLAMVLISGVSLGCDSSTPAPTEEIALPRLHLKQVWATLSELSAPVLETSNRGTSWEGLQELPKSALQNLWESVQTVEAPDDAQALESAYLGVACLRRIQRNLREFVSSPYPKAKQRLLAALNSDRATLADALGALEGHLHIGVERAKKRRRRGRKKTETDKLPAPQDDPEGR